MVNRREVLMLGVVAICCFLVYKLRKKQLVSRRRKQWVKPWLQRKQGRGTLALLNKELKYEDPTAYKNFLRLDTTQFNMLLNLVLKDIKREDTFMRESISPEQRLNVTLRFLATGETYRSLMYSTRIHESTISKIIPDTCRAICKNLKSEYLKIPKTPEEWLKIAAGYENNWNFPNCIGALDGRHIAFSAPISSGSTYHNYKGTDSIILLGLVDANYKFIYVNVGVNGRVSDGGVFSSCKLYEKLNNNTLNLPNCRALPGRIMNVPYVIIADNAFPLSQHLIKPFPQRDLTYKKRIFNYRLSRARRMVECAFGILANRWRVLLQKIHLGPEKVELVTLTCVILHNFLATENSKYTEGGLDNINPAHLLPQIQNQWRNRSSTSAQAIRNEFLEFFNSHSGSVPWKDESVQSGN